jgi:hypothetical protein
MNGPERSSGGHLCRVSLCVTPTYLPAALCTPGGTVILPAPAKKRAGNSETDVVVAVVRLVPVAVGRAEVVWIVVVPGTAAQNALRHGAVQAPGRDTWDKREARRRRRYVPPAQRLV